jgi:hypothetical protein
MFDTSFLYGYSMVCMVTAWMRAWIDGAGRMATRDGARFALFDTNMPSQH